MSGTTVTTGGAGTDPGSNGRVRVENVSKFDGTKASFAKYHIKLKAAIRNNGCGLCLDASSSAVAALKSIKPGKRSEEQNKLVQQCNALYIILISTITDDIPSGEDLLIYLDSTFERSNTGLDYDDGAGAYRYMRNKFGGMDQTSTTELLSSIKEIKLIGNSPEEVQNFLSSLSDGYTKLARGGEIVSNEQKKANLLSGISATPGWSAFRVQVQQDDLKAKQPYELITYYRYYTVLTPLVLHWY